MDSYPSTQRAVVMTGKRQPYAEIEVPVFPPASGEILVRVGWTASTPLDLHRADGGLLIPSYPARAGGGGIAGTVVAVGQGVDELVVGDSVMAFAFHGGKEANHQEYVTIPRFLAGKVPPGMTLREACTVPVNLVTVFHTATADLGLELPWPRRLNDQHVPAAVDAPILVWGASSSVGIFALQVLRHWGYTHLLAVSSDKHHAYLRHIGAAACFDYADADVVESILGRVRRDTVEDINDGPLVPYILDCIGSLGGSLQPLTRIAQRGSRVAVMLPVIIKDATDDEEPEYEMDVSRCLADKWADGVILRGARTHHYLEVGPVPTGSRWRNEYFKQKLQSEIIPALLAQKVVEPNRQRVVEGASMVERAQKALALLRSRAVSGERLVWRVAG
ncbi:hypothetical protein RJ55_00437 [Drechmeria coniospora]|nr:hypothetical protein RJ55_00437 [Drechmeria coniospora]